MADSDHDIIANRDEPIPVVRIPSRHDEPATPVSDSDESHRRRDRLKNHAGKIKDAFAELGSGEGRQSLQDRFLNGIMSQIIPPEDLSENEDATMSKSSKPDRRSRQYVDRPGFSVGQMSSNFRRFNARVGVLFVLQNRLIHLFTWRHPTATMSFLAVYSLVCLQPQLLPIVPLVGLLFWIMIPSFLARHPAPANDPRVEPSYRGPPVAPASRVKPAPEMSKDFFRNMRDLQNSMEDFSRLHDAANELVTPYTNFSDEGVSSLLFVALFALCCVAFVGSNLVPWRAVSLIAGWVMIPLGHPEAQKILMSSNNIHSLNRRLSTLKSNLRNFIASDIILDSPPERRQVEIFELQKYHYNTGTWEPWLFTPKPYMPLAPSRISGARPKGTQFFEEVQPPQGWAWRDKKWNLDLSSQEWIEERMITGVEVETEGERWVYDLPAEEMSELGDPTSPKKGKSKVTEVPRSGWEEGTGLEKRGEWRRRRWVRVVERRVESAKEDAGRG